MHTSLSFQHLLLGIFAVGNPFSALGPFLGICYGVSNAEQEKLCRIASISALITMLLAMIAGKAILDFFGISIDAFRIAGGAILFISGIGMLNSKTDVVSTDNRKANFAQKIPVAIVPIAIPLTAGAGTISTITLFSEQLGRSHQPLWGLLFAIFIMSAVAYIVFRYSPVLHQVLGNTGMNVLVKITGLVTLALGTQFIISGIGSVFPILLHN